MQRMRLLPFQGVGLITEHLRVVFRAELLQLDKEVAKMCLESRQVHFDVKHALHELRNLTSGQVRKARDEQRRYVIPKKSWVGLPRRLRRWIEQWNSNLIHLHQVKHQSKQSCMHLETGLVQSIRHHRENVLYEGE